MTKKQLEKTLKEKKELLRKVSQQLQSLSCLCLEIDQLIKLDQLGDLYEKKAKKKT